MTAPRKSPAEAWDALEDMALEVEAERLATLSDDELDQELAERGIDPAAARERGAKLAAELTAKYGRAPGDPPLAPHAASVHALPPRARPRAWLGGGGFAMALAAAIAALFLWRGRPRNDSIAVDPSLVRPADDSGALEPAGNLVPDAAADAALVPPRPRREK